MDLAALLEPEEAVGHWWHNTVGDRATAPHFPEASVSFKEVSSFIGVFFRGLGGAHGIEIKPGADNISHHRLSFFQSLGREKEKVSRASYNGDSFYLPEVIDVFPDQSLNKKLYLWLSAWTVIAARIPVIRIKDPLVRDLTRLRNAYFATLQTLELFPGLRRTYEELSRELLKIRPKRKLPTTENNVEQIICGLLGDNTLQNRLFQVVTDQSVNFEGVRASKKYRPYFPVPLWGEIADLPVREKTGQKHEETSEGSNAPAENDDKVRKAKRRNSDEILKDGGLIVHRFEKILSWSEFMNLHRDAEDDDEDQAKKAADDHDEIGLGEHKRKTSTRLKMDLDLSPADVDAERMSDTYTYPEWDYRKADYLPDHTRILAHMAEPDLSANAWRPDREASRRIHAVKKQLEALRPKREHLKAQLDGHDLDMDALIRAKADLIATGEGSDRIYTQARQNSRDLAVAVLIDVSRSTESYVDEQPVIDVEKEALIALAKGIAACGDDCGLYAFSSLKRDRVYVSMLKDYEEKPGSLVMSRIAGLRPGFYTRLGAAVRHVSSELSRRPNEKKLLLVLTDGKPNDLDHYDGRYGIEDSRKSIDEARRMGLSVFGITVDSEAKAYFPRIFRRGAYSIMSSPSKLTLALPKIYRQLLG